MLRYVGGTFVGGIFLCGNTVAGWIQLSVEQNPWETCGRIPLDTQNAQFLTDFHVSIFIGHGYFVTSF